MLVKQRFDLSRLNLGRRVKRLRDDAGSTMVTVLIVMLVLTVGGVAIAGVSFNTAIMVVASKDRTSAQAVVDGAIASLTVDLMDGTIPCDTASPTEGSAKNGTAASSPVYNWKLVCSESGTAGTATLSAASNVDGQKAVREAVFSYELEPSTTIDYGSPDDPIMLFGDNTTTFNSNNLVLGTNSIHVSIPRGNLICNTPFPGNLVVYGNITVQGGCTVGGNLISVTGTISGNTLKVEGDVVSYGSVSLNSNSEIKGSLYSSTGSLSIQGSRVYGNVQTKGNIETNGSRIDGNASSSEGTIKLGYGDSVTGAVTTGGTGTNTLPGTVGSIHTLGSIDFTYSDKTIPGAVTAAGDIILRNTKVLGTITLPASKTLTKENWENGSWGALVRSNVIAPATPTMPTMPTMPSWFEYQFKTSDWPGYTVVTLKNTVAGGSADPLECSHYNANSGGVNDNSPGKPNGWSTIKNLTGNTIIDARACPKLTTNMGLGPTIELNHNLVLLAKEFDLTPATFKAGASANPGSKPKLWILKEDTVDDGAPTCTPAGSTGLNDTKAEASIATMVYTPCEITISANSSVNGQLYGGRWSSGAGIRFSAEDIGLPGMGGVAPPSGGGVVVGGGVKTGSFSLVSAQDLPVA